MTQSNANVTVIQQAYERFGRGDIEGILNLIADDVVWEEPTHPAIPYGGKRQGKETVRAFFAAVAQVEVREFAPVEYIASGDRVIALGHWAGTVRRTGKAFRSAWAMAWTVRDGKIHRFCAYEDTAVVGAAFTA